MVEGIHQRESSAKRRRRDLFQAYMTIREEGIECTELRSKLSATQKIAVGLCLGQHSQRTRSLSEYLADG